MEKNLTHLDSKLEHYIDSIKGLAHNHKIKKNTGHVGKALLTVLPIAGAMLQAPDTNAQAVAGNKFQLGAAPIQSIVGTNTTFDLNVGTDRFIVFTNVAGGANHRFDIDVIGNAFIINPTNANDRVAGFNAGGYNYVDAFADNLNTSAWCGTASFINASRMYLNYPSAPNDEWTFGTIYKLGVRMQEGGQNYFGWIRLRLDDSAPPFGVTYYGTNYESTAGSCAVLPVELLSFKVKATKENIQLNWQTASEIDNAGFEVQRSENGKDFKNLAFIEGKGNSVEKQDYHFDDRSLYSGQTYYYRLKQIDHNGQFEYSEVITASLEIVDKAVGTFAPNPVVSGLAQLNYTTPNAGSLHLRVFDVTGRELWNQVKDVHAGVNNLNLDLSSLSGGIYFTKMEQDGNVLYEQIIIE